MTEGITPRHSFRIRDVLVATGETDRLERYDRNLVCVVDGIANHWSNLLVVDTSNDRHHQHHVNPGRVEVLDGCLFDVE